MNADCSDNFCTLTALYREERDYRITCVRRKASPVAIIAPHGDRIERGTSKIARAIAGAEHNLYLFEGRLEGHNYERLHLTSTRFDEPRCLALLRECEFVVAIHGCNGEGEQVLVGGCDKDLGLIVADHSSSAGLSVLTDGHAFPGTDPRNIRNRGRRAKGAQLELTDDLRGGPSQIALVAAVRTALAQCLRTGTAASPASAAG